jgi:hypothetical protein
MRHPVAHAGLTFPESNKRKVIADGCTGKADFIVFSICNDPSIGSEGTHARKKSFIHLISTFLWDVCAETVEKRVLGVRAKCCGLPANGWPSMRFGE